jgi:hypothetical protein
MKKKAPLVTETSQPVQNMYYYSQKLENYAGNRHHHNQKLEILQEIKYLIYQIWISAGE